MKQAKDRRLTSRTLLGALCALLGGPLSGATIPVTTLLDVDAADGLCSLREAIAAANLDAPGADCPAGVGADEIEIDIPGSVLLASNLPVITDGLTVRGLGAALSTIDGAGLHSLLSFPGPASGVNDWLRLESLSLVGGVAANGGGVLVGDGRSLEVVDCRLEANSAGTRGGAIRGQGSATVEIRRSTIVGNSAVLSGGGVSVFDGGSLWIIDSTVATNVVTGGNGGGAEAYIVGELQVVRSTFSGNQAANHGGAIAVVFGGGTRIAHSTLHLNRADSDQNDTGWGGGIDASGATTVTLANSIVAGNEDLSATNGHCPDLNARLGAEFASEGGNLIGDGDCESVAFPPGTPNGNGDLVGNAALPLDPGLEPLADYRGPTATHRPLTSSVVIDQGACPGETVDQRGFFEPLSGLRPVDDPLAPDAADGCDIGAVERHPELPFLDDFESGDSSRWSSTVP
jgi:CSLREA domain-containing protein